MERTTHEGGEERQEGLKPVVPWKDSECGEGEEKEEEEKEVVSLCGLSLAREHLLMLSVATGLLFLLLIIVVTSVVTTSGASKPLPSFSTGGDMLDFLVQTCDIIRADGLLATWYHRANNKSEMNKALASSAMILEADVNLEGFGTANQKPVPIMSHDSPPNVYSDNTLDQWLDAVLSSSKGIKLDFKSLASVGPSLDVLSRKNQSRTIGRPVWINADIVTGPNVPDYIPVVNGTAFLQLVQEKFPDVTISPGWKVAYAPPFVKPYTSAMVKEMYDLVKDLPQKVTFPVHALLVRKSWQHISWLLSQLPRASLTLWQGAVHPEVNDLLFVRDNSHPSRVLYDIYEPTLSAFRLAARAEGRVRRFYPGGDLLDYFYPVTNADRDPLAVDWFTVFDRDSLMELLSGDGRGMLVVWVGSGTGGVPLVEGSGRNRTEPLSLQEVLALLPEARGAWGLYVRARGLGVLEAALNLLSSAYSQDRLYRPVWVSTELPHNAPTQQVAILSGEMVSRVEGLFPHVTLVLRGRSWPPHTPAPAGGWSMRVALSLDPSLLPSDEELGGVWSSVEGWDLLVEEERREGDGGRSREGLAILQAFSIQQRESRHTRVYYLTNQQPGCCD